MSQYPGPGYLFAPITGGAGMTPLVFDTTDPKAGADKVVKAAEPMDRPYLSGSAGQWPGYGNFPTGFNRYYAYLMRNYPICNLVHRKLAGPVISGTRSIEIVDDGGDSDLANTIKEAVDRILLPMLAKAIPGALESPFYGNALQEMVWARDPKTKWVNLVNVRPAMPYSQIIHVNEAREYTGYMMMGQYRDARYGFLSVNNPHIDDVMGWSPNQAALADYFRATKSAENADAIERKASGIQLIMYAAAGMQFFDINQKPVDMKKFMDEMMNAAVTGKSVVFPKMAFTKDAIEKMPALADVKPIEHDRFDWGNLGPAIEAHTARERNLDVHIGWAWGVSERSLMEADKGGMGTSDAEEHGESNSTISEEWHSRICGEWDDQATARWIDVNFRDSGVILKTVPKRADPKQDFKQKAILAMLSDPKTAMEMTAQVNKRELMESADFPLVTEDQANQAIANAKAEEQKQQDAKNKIAMAGKQKNPAATQAKEPNEQNKGKSGGK